jgi:hypothetical protein
MDRRCDLAGRFCNLNQKNCSACFPNKVLEYRWRELEDGQTGFVGKFLQGLGLGWLFNFGTPKHHII